MLGLVVHDYRVSAHTCVLMSTLSGSEPQIVSSSLQKDGNNWHGAQLRLACGTPSVSLCSFCN